MDHGSSYFLHRTTEQKYTFFKKGGGGRGCLIIVFEQEFRMRVRLCDFDKFDWFFFLYISAVKETCLPINS